MQDRLYGSPVRQMRARLCEHQCRSVFYSSKKNFYARMPRLSALRVRRQWRGEQRVRRAERAVQVQEQFWRVAMRAVREGVTVFFF